MERDTKDTDITNDALLSIELKSREFSTIQSHPGNSATCEEKLVKESAIMKPISSTSSPRLPEDIIDAESSTVQRKSVRYLSSGDHFTTLADNHDAEGLSLPRDEPEPSRKTDCLLLDYQNQLFFLESLNRRTSRKAKQMR